VGIFPFSRIYSFFHTWIKHPPLYAYFDQMALTNKQYDKINLPILTITGHYDGDQPGVMEYYRKYMESNSKAKNKHYLVIGPWDHPGTRTPNAEFGGLKFSEASFLDSTPQRAPGWWESPRFQAD
jgi:predicted acyl esterase